MTEETPQSALPLLLRFELRRDYLYAHVAGSEISREIALSVWRRLADECARTGARRLLLENGVTKQLSVTDTYDVGRALPDIQGLRGVRIALLDRRRLDFGLVLFGETVAVNRGLAGRVFDDLGDAERWLESDVSD